MLFLRCRQATFDSGFREIKGVGQPAEKTERRRPSSFDLQFNDQDDGHSGRVYGPQTLRLHEAGWFFKDIGSSGYGQRFPVARRDFRFSP